MGHGQGMAYLDRQKELWSLQVPSEANSALEGQHSRVFTRLGNGLHPGEVRGSLCDCGWVRRMLDCHHQ